MSHETAELGRKVLYTSPCPFSDAVRTFEFDDFFQDYRGPCFSVCTLDGWSWSSSQFRVAEFTATFKSRDALDTVIGDASEASLGRIFLNGNLELDGNILLLLSVAQYTLRHSEGLSRNLIRDLARFSHQFSKRIVPERRSSRADNWFYSPGPLDLPANFFEGWLGSSLAHCCCCFAENAESVESAQHKSLERACEWLEVEWQDRLLEIGCGWGTLLMHAAEHHGVLAHGITASETQSHIVAERIHHRSLDRQCTVEHRNLRTKPYRAREFDKIAHLGIFEQVAIANLDDYLRCLRELLAPGGLLLLHRLTRSHGSVSSFTTLPCDFLADSISRELLIAEKNGLELVAVVNLNDEYEKTIRVWIERLIRTRHVSASSPFSSAYRTWTLYLIELATCLNSGESQVHRVLLRRRN